MEPILELNNLRLRRNGKNIINNVSLELEKGRIHAVVGPNGAGKSTLGYVVMGLKGYSDYEGGIIFDGQKIDDLSVDERAKLGITLAWQEPARFEGLTVRQYLKASANGSNGKGKYYDIAEALEKVGLEPKDYLDRAADTTLSGGERKRIELASIIAMKPKLVLLDEPDSGVDIDALNYIFDTIKYVKKNGATVVMITHSLEMLKKAEHGFLMCNGRLVDTGNVKDTIRYFKNKCIECRHKNYPKKEVLR